MTQQKLDKYEIMDVSLLAGKIMLESGAETYRVEDTMMRIAASYGIKKYHSYVTPTGIMFSLETKEPTKTKLIRISERTTDLKKVTMVNSVSRTISQGHISLEEAYEMLQEIEATNVALPLWVQLAAASISSGCFLIMFHGLWSDFIPHIFSGGLGLLAALLVASGLGTEIDKIIIGSVMPLVPGLSITNAVRDLMAGHLLSGLSKGAEAFLTAFAIGAGIAIVFTLL